VLLRLIDSTYDGVVVVVAQVNKGERKEVTEKGGNISNVYLNLALILALLTHSRSMCQWVMCQIW